MSSSSVKRLTTLMVPPGCNKLRINCCMQGDPVPRGMPHRAASVNMLMRYSARCLLHHSGESARCEVSVTVKTHQADSLYPPIEPYRTGYLRVDPNHRVYFEESGNPKGKPVVFLHGGPGGGTEP